jgi:hypothetical protein
VPLASRQQTVVKPNPKRGAPPAGAKSNRPAAGILLVAGCRASRDRCGPTNAAPPRPGEVGGRPIRRGYNVQSGSCRLGAHLDQCRWGANPVEILKCFRWCFARKPAGRQFFLAEASLFAPYRSTLDRRVTHASPPPNIPCRRAMPNFKTGSQGFAAKGWRAKDARNG